MKKIALLGILCTPLITANVWADTNEKASSSKPTTPQIKTNAGFNAQIVLAAGDGQAARKDWKGIAAPHAISSVSQGSTMSTLIGFSGCTPNAKGVCDVSVEFFVVSPDGVKKPGGSGAVWSGAPFSIPNVLLLGQASLTASFDNTDPIGDYKVLANVTDQVSGKVLHLSQNFKVTK